MSVRYYVVPTVAGGLGFVPKYVGAGQSPGIAGAWAAFDYGFEPTYLLAAEVTPSEHTALAANSDVIAIPTPISNLVGAGAVATVRSKLESLRLPGNWVTTAHTYSDVLRFVGQACQILQAFQGLFGISPFADGITLDTTFGAMTQAQRDQWIAVAAQLSLDTSGITGGTTLRAALIMLADEMPPISLLGVTF